VNRNAEVRSQKAFGSAVVSQRTTPSMSSARGVR
jgi:hypothetical protein